VRVLIVDDQALFAEAVQVALVDHGLDVTIAHDEETALSRSDEPDPPDLVLIDLGLPSETGLDVGRKMLERCPETQVVALAALHDPAVADEALRSGFSGYLTKETNLAKLVNVIRVVADGGVVVADELVRTPARRLPCDDPEAAMLLAQLTSRELEVLELLSAGRASDDIATALHISRNTVRTHVQGVLAKLGVHSRLQAAAFASKHRLFDPPKAGA
jgi:two-component system, NarL family, nitrate/nitrite response regulator NarL